jgi:hypothetical protein
MLNISIIAFLAITIYYFNFYRSYSYVINDDIIHHTTLDVDHTTLDVDHTTLDVDHVLSDDSQMNILVTDYYKDLNTYVMPTERIIPLQVFYDHDGLSFTKSIYECIDYYNNHNEEIMKNTKHIKIIIINTNEKSYCIMNTDLII